MKNFFEKKHDSVCVSEEGGSERENKLNQIFSFENSTGIFAYD